MGKTIHQNSNPPQGEAQGQQATQLTPYDLLVRCDYSVIPSGGGDTGKSPLVPWEQYQHKAPELENLQAWEKELQPRLWGVVTGAVSRVVVIDVDKPELRASFDKVGLSPHIQTPRGGFHYWFEHPGYPIKTKAGLLPSIDIRGDGGFINVIGQRSDGAYTVLIPPSPDKLYPWDKLPTQIAKALTRQKTQAPPVEGDIIPEHKRNDTLARLAGALRKKGVPVEAIESAMQAINLTTCKPPLGKDEVTSIVQSIAKYRPTASRIPDGEVTLTNTDIGNAERLVKLYGSNLRYCYEYKKWLVWNGKYWQPDLGARINRCAMLTVRNIYREAAAEPDTDKSKALARHAITSESNHRILAMIGRAESQIGIPVDATELDNNDWLLNCKNGTINLHTGALLPHTKEHLITLMIPVEYHPDAECPLWHKFLDRVTNSDQELIVYLQKCVGYSLTGDTRNELVFFIHGDGQNGKSTFVHTIRKLMAGYGHRISPDTIMTINKSTGGPKEGLANLKGKRYVLASEIEEGRRLKMALLKAITGAETITADRKWEHEVEYQPTHKLWLSGNYQPEVRDNSVAAWRRLKLVPFEVHIPDNERNDSLKFELWKELPGILAWAVQGCLAYQKEGLNEPRAVAVATDTYRREQDIMGNFIDECCIEATPEQVSKSDLRNLLKTWCASNNFDSLNTHQVKALLRRRGLDDGVSSDGKHRVWKGIRIRTDQDPPLPDKPDNSDNTDKILVVKPQSSPYRAKQQKNTEKTLTNVKTSESVDNDNEPPRPVEPCQNCKSNDWVLAGWNEWVCPHCHPAFKGKE